MGHLVLGYMIAGATGFLIGSLVPWLVILVLFQLDFTGLFCGLIGYCLSLIPTTVGVALGIILRRYLKTTNFTQRFFLPFFLTIPFLSAAIEAMLPHPVDIASVATETVFDSPPLATWNSILFYEEVQHEPPLLLRLALPRPVRSEGSKSAAGNIVRCVYVKGHLTKEITEVQPGKLLAFKVVDQKLHFERDVALLDGRFKLEPLENGRTRVVLETRYRRLLEPSWIWSPIERLVTRALHRHVLEGMRQRNRELFPEPPNRLLPEFVVKRG